MKKQLQLILLLLLSGWAFAQQTPEFSFELYFEDAAGNKDTVIIGYDEQATNGIDSNFGEIDILNQPWDGNLEARVGDKTYSGLSSSEGWIQPNTYLSKKQIVKSYCQEIDYPERVSIQFTTNNYPLTMKWDKSLFEDDCHKYSFLFGQDDHYHFDVTGYLMLGSLDSLVIDSLLDFSGRELASYEMNGNKIGVLQFVFHRYTTVSVFDYKIEETKVFPNPFNDFIVLPEGLQATNIKLMDLNGKEVNFNMENNKIFPVNCVPGVYFLKIESEYETYQYKIIKE